MKANSSPGGWRQALAEALGTGLLVAVVVGSGIAAARFSPEDLGLQLLESSIATALGLAVLIVLLAPVSGAHVNPLVSLADAILDRNHRGRPRMRTLVWCIPAQVLGGIGGAVLANLMFDVPTRIAATERSGSGILVGELVATAGLVLLIFGLARSGRGPLTIGPAVGAYIGAAYWFTSSTSFANPAVTVGRMFSDTFAGIAPSSVLPFLGAQLIGAAVGVGLVLVLFPKPHAESAPAPAPAPER